MKHRGESIMLKLSLGICTRFLADDLPLGAVHFTLQQIWLKQRVFTDRPLEPLLQRPTGGAFLRSWPITVLVELAIGESMAETVGDSPKNAFLPTGNIIRHTLLTQNVWAMIRLLCLAQWHAIYHLGLQSQILQNQTTFWSLEDLGFVKGEVVLIYSLKSGWAWTAVQFTDIIYVLFICTVRSVPLSFQQPLTRIVPQI